MPRGDHLRSLIWSFLSRSPHRDTRWHSAFLWRLVQHRSELFSFKIRFENASPVQVGSSFADISWCFITAVLIVNWSSFLQVYCLTVLCPRCFYISTPGKSAKQSSFSDLHKSDFYCNDKRRRMFIFNLTADPFSSQVGEERS